VLSILFREPKLLPRGLSLVVADHNRKALHRQRRSASHKQQQSGQVGSQCFSISSEDCRVPAGKPVSSVFARTLVTPGQVLCLAACARLSKFSADGEQTAKRRSGPARPSKMAPPGSSTAPITGALGFLSAGNRADTSPRSSTESTDR